MATRGATAQPVTQLCDYCNQKPKFSNHQYCSKTCASQAASLCNQCHKKPKFQNFEYCGKNCASVAKPQVRKIATGVTPTPPAPTVAPKGKTKNANPQPSSNTFDPVQIAKLVVQQIPHVRAILASTNAPTVAPVAPVTQPVAAAPVPQVVAPATGSKNPFLNLINQVQSAASSNGTSAVSSNPVPAAQPLHISTQPATNTSECLIPGCEQPVHVDAKGLKTSDYCSMRHREEAVTSGLASPCIMCLTLPQGETDYFCGWACRDDANKKLE